MKKLLFSLVGLLMVISTSVFAQYADGESFKINPADFKKMTAYIEKHGFVVKENGVPCDHEIVFIDRDRNRFGMVTIRRDKNSRPSVNAPIDQIAVWAYKKGIKDDHHFFGGTFLITEYVGTGVSVSADPDLTITRKGYQQFLKKVKG